MEDQSTMADGESVALIKTQRGIFKCLRFYAFLGSKKKIIVKMRGDSQRSLARLYLSVLPRFTSSTGIPFIRASHSDQ